MTSTRHTRKANLLAGAAGTWLSTKALRLRKTFWSIWGGGRQNSPAQRCSSAANAPATLHSNGALSVFSTGITPYTISTRPSRLDPTHRPCRMSRYTKLGDFRTFNRRPRVGNLNIQACSRQNVTIIEETLHLAGCCCRTISASCRFLHSFNGLINRQQRGGSNRFTSAARRKGYGNRRHIHVRGHLDD